MNPIERTARTYRLRPSVLAQLDAASARLAIPQSLLVDALLAHVLEEEAAGRLVIARKPTAWAIESIYTTTE